MCMLFQEAVQYRQFILLEQFSNSTVHVCVCICGKTSTPSMDPRRGGTPSPTPPHPPKEHSIYFNSIAFPWANLASRVGADVLELPTMKIPRSTPENCSPISCNMVDKRFDL